MLLYDIFRGLCWFVFFFHWKILIGWNFYLFMSQRYMIGEERQCLAFLLAEKEIHFAFSLAKHVKVTSRQPGRVFTFVSMTQLYLVQSQSEAWDIK